MKSDLKNCPVDWGITGKKDYTFLHGILKNSTYGGAGDPTNGNERIW